MKKEILLKHIAETAYNVGFGAKKHFATYDIVTKAPGLISFTSLAVGILGFVIPCLTLPHVSAALVILGVMGLFISHYNADKDKCCKAGEELTGMFNELKAT